MIGLLAELVVRTYHESQSKTTYSIRKLLNLRAIGKESEKIA